MALKAALQALQAYYTELDGHRQATEHSTRVTTSTRLPRTRRSATNTSTKKSPAPDVYYIYPHPRAFIHRASGKLQVFTYETIMNGRSFLFTGKTAENKNICIKFVRRYGLDVHLWFARKGYAPELIAFDTLSDGWFMVVMDLLDKSWIHLADVEDPPGDLQHLIRSVLIQLHQEKMVHGDLRDTNIMVKSDEKLKFMVLDYDWAGTQGEVKYPLFVNTTRGLWRPSDVEDDVLISDRHDLAMVENMFRLL